ncbi:MAG: endonuclease/exonuclease/phosphatase family protein, partial [Muribaculaceae bacterium]|nr:endonuclease/exonuclease/phosphatase family protein [Muribaculaceae bacterium]
SYAISQMKTRTTPMGPAVIGVSEIENESVLQDLVASESIRDMNLQVIHHDSPDPRGVDVGLLYNPRLFKPINVTNHPLSIPELPKFRTRDQMCVVGLLGGSRVGIIVNHWPSRRGGSAESSWLREAAAALSVHIADSLMKIDPNIGIIIMGDLNDDPSNRSCAETLGACRNAADVKPGGFFNPFWEKLDHGIGSYIYRGAWDLFDQIIINYNLLTGAGGLEYIGAEVLNKEFLKQQDGQYKGYPLRTFSGGVWTNGYSDHFPTEIFLKKEVVK